MSNVLNAFMKVRVMKHEGFYLPNKPLLLLAALGRCRTLKPRLTLFRVYEDILNSLSHEFGEINAVYPFGRLSGDQIWEIPLEPELHRNSSGDLLRSELIEKGIVGGFPVEIYNTFLNNHELISIVATKLLEKFILQEKHNAVISAFNLFPKNLDLFSESDSYTKEPLDNSDELYANSITTRALSEARVEDTPMANHSNNFIAYLNSLHSLSASGANALAESQALSPYFGELYEPLPLIEDLVKILTEKTERVVILTGHAGDGKSTVALDVLKKLRGLPLAEALDRPLSDREDIVVANSKVTIVKDMSELSAECRQQWLRQGFSEPGSWLIVSNTGPLLSSLNDYADSSKSLKRDIESAILECLDQPLDNSPLDDRHSLDGFSKKLLILNLTQLDNVALGAKLLTKLVRHSGWEKCIGCSIEPVCPLLLNRRALLDALPVAEDRVRWIYQRLHAYEQRLTLRQIVAQLAFGLTGGMSCDEAQQKTMVSTVEEEPNRSGAGLERILFSEGFFGYSASKPHLEAAGLRAVALTRRAIFGAPVGVNFERLLMEDAGIGWAVLPPSLNWVSNYWRQKAVDAAGVRWRFALRRMAYLFGKAAPGKEQLANVFLDAFVQSPSLRDLDKWQIAGELTLSRAEAKHLHTSCLGVLLEIFSGFSISQFKSRHEALYLTLRRPDRAVVQPTQIVIKTLSFRDFDLRFDPIQNIPLLSYDKGRVELILTLPLLDYIRRRDAGELGNELSPIHQAQLDWFRGELLQATTETRRDDEGIELLRVGIDGKVHVRQFFLDQKQGILEQ